MARHLPRLSVTSAAMALAFVAAGVLLGSPARAITLVDPAGPTLLSLGNERVLTFPVAAVAEVASAARMSPLRAMDGSSYTSRALDSVNRNHIQLGLTGSISELRTLVSSAGERQVHIQQRISGIPVMGGEAVVDLTPTGETRAIVSDFLSGAAPENLVPRITSAQAFEAYVRSSAKASPQNMRSKALSSVLSIYDPRIFGAPGVPRAQLVWRLVVRGSDPAQSTRTVLVDAQHGSVLLDIANDQKLAGVTVCDDESAPNSQWSIGCDVVDHGGTTLPAARLTAYATGNSEVDGAYDNSVSTLQFYARYLGVNSVDRRGQTITSIVNYCPLVVKNEPKDCPHYNAEWNGDRAIFGTGFAIADDVVAHEITHGLTQNTADLFYYYQSGAINESLSDVFGEFVDQTDGHDVVGGPSTNLWQLGEDFTWSDGQDVKVGPIRNMRNPTTSASIDGPQPDSTNSRFYGNHSPLDGAGLFDNGDVHVNSGVGNKFAYLLTDTSSSNPNGVGVGIGKAAPIIFGAEKLLTSGADYRQFAAALRLSCSALMGKKTPHGEVIGQRDCVQVDHAIKTVRMDATPRGTQSAAAICPTGRKARVLWHDAMENQASGRWMKSTAGAHSTPALWYYGSQKIPYYGDYSVGRYATSGNNELFGIDPDPGATYTSYSGRQIRIFPSHATYADHRESMTRRVKIPRDVPVFVRFNHSFGFDSTLSASGVSNSDGGVVEYSTDGGKKWIDAGSLMLGSGNNGYNGQIDYWGDPDIAGGHSTNPIVSFKKQAHDGFVGQSKGYESTRAALTSLAGKAVQIRFRVTADQTVGGLGWFVDDVQFYSCPLA